MDAPRTTLPAWALPGSFGRAIARRLSQPGVIAASTGMPLLRHAASLGERHLAFVDSLSVAPSLRAAGPAPGDDARVFRRPVGPVATWVRTDMPQVARAAPVAVVRDAAGLQRLADEPASTADSLGAAPSGNSIEAPHGVSRAGVVIPASAEDAPSAVPHPSAASADAAGEPDAHGGASGGNVLARAPWTGASASEPIERAALPLALGPAPDRTPMASDAVSRGGAGPASAQGQIASLAASVPATTPGLSARAMPLSQRSIPELPHVGRVDTDPPAAPAPTGPGHLLDAIHAGRSMAAAVPRPSTPNAALMPMREPTADSASIGARRSASGQAIVLPRLPAPEAGALPSPGPAPDASLAAHRHIDLAPRSFPANAVAADTAPFDRPAGAMVQRRPAAGAQGAVAHPSTPVGRGETALFAAASRLSGAPGPLVLSRGSVPGPASESSARTSVDPPAAVLTPSRASTEGPSFDAAPIDRAHGRDETTAPVFRSSGAHERDAPGGSVSETPSAAPSAEESPLRVARSGAFPSARLPDVLARTAADPPRAEASRAAVAAPVTALDWRRPSRTEAIERAAVPPSPAEASGHGSPGQDDPMPTGPSVAHPTPPIDASTEPGVARSDRRGGTPVLPHASAVRQDAVDRADGGGALPRASHFEVDRSRAHPVPPVAAFSPAPHRRSSAAAATTAPGARVAAPSRSSPEPVAMPLAASRAASDAGGEAPGGELAIHASEALPLEAPSAASAPSTVHPAGAPAQAPAVDLDDLVERACQAVFARLVVEQERRGYARWA